MYCLVFDYRLLHSQLILVHIPIFFNTTNTVVNIFNELFECIKTVFVRLRKTCEVPDTEGSVFSYYGSNQSTILSSGTPVEQNRLVTEKCLVEYYQKADDRYILCSGGGKLIPTYSDKLCLSEYNDVLCIDLLLRHSEMSKRLKVRFKEPNGYDCKQKYTCVLFV